MSCSILRFRPQSHWTRVSKTDLYSASFCSSQLQLERFIEYFTRKDAEKAIRTLDGRRLLGNEVRVVGWEVGICASSDLIVLMFT
jgi:hypothetical protein